jgi:hypothetical protein
MYSLLVGGSWVGSELLHTELSLDGGVAWRPAEIVAVVAAGSAGVSLGRDDWKDVSQTLLPPEPPVEGIVSLTAAGSLTLQLEPISGEIGRMPLRVGFLAGPAVVRTRDDLAALDREDDPESIATEIQLHPALRYGAALRLNSGRPVGVQLQVDHLRWIEVLESSDLVLAGRLAVSAGIVWTPGVGAAQPRG